MIVTRHDHKLTITINMKDIDKKMTLDEAIQHCHEVAESCENKECALNHEQLANWLEELKCYKINC